ncbi:MAG TPA: VOC family protein [Fimbriimonadaceae bacterium]|nr:VOC family protein [Fimbriimonadaceae bacterium]
MGKSLINGLDTVWCPVTDMERSVAFYRDVLGLKPGFESPYWTSFDLGGVQLGLHFGGGKPGGGFVVSVLTDDLPALRSRLVGANCEVGEYHDTPRGTVMDIADPDGNRLQAMQLGTKAAEFEK